MAVSWAAPELAARRTRRRRSDRDRRAVPARGIRNIRRPAETNVCRSRSQDRASGCSQAAITPSPSDNNVPSRRRPARGDNPYISPKPEPHRRNPEERSVAHNVGDRRHENAGRLRRVYADTMQHLRDQARPPGPNPTCRPALRISPHIPREQGARGNGACGIDDGDDGSRTTKAP